MPTNLLSIAVNWFASHLVILSLLGFLLAGLMIVGVIDAPVAGDRQSGEAVSRGVMPDRDLGTATHSRATVTETRPLHSAPAAVTQAGTSADAADAAHTGTPSHEPGRQGPRLIGGSLPIYGQPGVADGAFRPPGEAPPPVEMTRDDYLQRARREFWNDEFEAAESAYMALISAYPEDADAFGELGNLYQSMGKSDRARDAYYEAAVRLKAAGNNEKFKEIMELLEHEGDDGGARLNH